MNNELELLELAAKAMGFSLVPDMPKNDGEIYVWITGHVVRWNPLHKQADSADLRDGVLRAGRASAAFFKLTILCDEQNGHAMNSRPFSARGTRAPGS